MQLLIDIANRSREWLYLELRIRYLTFRINPLGSMIWLTILVLLLVFTSWFLDVFILFNLASWLIFVFNADNRKHVQAAVALIEGIAP